MRPMPDVVILATGGTIATSRNASSGELQVSLPGSQIASRVGAVGIEVRVEEVFRLPSTELTGAHLVDLCGEIERFTAAGVTGVVVTHGTATLEETAFFVSLVFSGDIPVIFTGAMRDADQVDADGPRNLQDALRVAVADASRGRGVLVVMDGEILNATSVVKRHANRVSAFTARQGGADGCITDAGIIYFRAPHAPTVHFSAQRVERRIDLVRSCLDLDPAVISSAMTRGVRGLVLEAMGADGIGPALKAPLLEALDQGVTVAVATRCAEGSSSPRYPVARELARRGAVFARTLDGLKARILLMLALGESPQRTDLQDLFDRVSGYACHPNAHASQKGAVPV
jgi:L-asparaginase